MAMDEGFYGVRILWVAALGLFVLLMGAALGSAQSLQEECSVELYDRIFKPSLAQMKTPYALVEFFASW